MTGRADPSVEPVVRRKPPPGFVIREIAIPAGGLLAYDAAQWHDTLVVIDQGELELECGEGLRFAFKPGDVLFLAGLGLRTIRSTGVEAVVLTAVSRWLCEPRPSSGQDHDPCVGDRVFDTLGEHRRADLGGDRFGAGGVDRQPADRRARSDG